MPSQYTAINDVTKSLRGATRSSNPPSDRRALIDEGLQQYPRIAMCVPSVPRLDGRTEAFDIVVMDEVRMSAQLIVSRLFDAVPVAESIYDHLSKSKLNILMGAGIPAHPPGSGVLTYRCRSCHTTSVTARH